MEFKDLKIGDVFESNNYGLFKVLGINSHSNITIEFMNTGNRKSSRFQNLIKSKVKYGNTSKYTRLNVGDILEGHNSGKKKL
ncbi:hypothetical protein [Enterobacter asburiae]|uniref:hypothetical protein n=1 Tax=Enterobacter asburiae TaxID=61645 RepID=UPI0011D1FA1D|nr:hypothetical protein [Enterobacter asburiae]